MKRLDRVGPLVGLEPWFVFAEGTAVLRSLFVRPGPLFEPWLLRGLCDRKWGPLLSPTDFEQRTRA